MSVLEKIVKESDFFYKKENLPKELQSINPIKPGSRNI